MTVSGSTIHRKIKDRIVEVEREHSTLSSSVYEYENQIAQVVDERERCYGRLAEIYLPEMTAQAVTQTLKEVQKDVQKIFEEKQHRRKELESLIETAKVKREKLEDKLEDITGQLNKKAAERDGLTARIAVQLQGNTDYVALSNEAKQTNARLEQNKARLQEVERDSEEKLKAYKANAQFIYLANREFGSGNYNAGWLTRIIDSRVAKKIRYSEQKKNYDYLLAMPQLMETEVQRRQEELEAILKRAHEIEQAEAEKHRLPEVLEGGARLGRERNQFMAEVEALDAKYSDYVKERTELDNTKGEYHQEAIRKLKAFLKGRDIGALIEKAEDTPTEEDNRILNRLGEIDARIKTLKYQSKEAKLHRDTVQEKLKGSKEILRKYAQNDFESERSYFDDGFDVEALLLGYVLGRYDYPHVWDRIEDQQHFKPRETYHRRSTTYHRRSTYDSDSGGSSGGGFGGGDFGGGSFSSGGGFGGRGFSSGSGF